MMLCTIGAITDRDITVRAASYGARPTQAVGTFMARELVACRSSDDVEHAPELMESHGKSRVICTVGDGRVVGVNGIHWDVRAPGGRNASS